MLPEDDMGLHTTTPVPPTGLGGQTVIDDDDLNPESMQVKSMTFALFFVLIITFFSF